MHYYKLLPNGQRIILFQTDICGATIAMTIRIHIVPRRVEQGPDIVNIMIQPLELGPGREWGRYFIGERAYED